MPCPFTARLSASYLSKYAPSLLQLYAPQCPVVSRAAATFHGEAAAATASASSAGQCPFLLDEVAKESGVVVAARHDNDVIQVEEKAKAKGELRR